MLSCRLSGAFFDLDQISRCFTTMSTTTPTTINCICERRNTQQVVHGESEQVHHNKRVRFFLELTETTNIIGETAFPFTVPDYRQMHFRIVPVISPTTVIFPATEWNSCVLLKKTTSHQIHSS